MSNFQKRKKKTMEKYIQQMSSFKLLGRIFQNRAQKEASLSLLRPVLTHAGGGRGKKKKTSHAMRKNL